MKFYHVITAFALLFSLASPSSHAVAQTPEKKQPEGNGSAQKLPSTYRQSKIGVPNLRELLATRGRKAPDGMKLTLVAPDEASHAQPVTVKASPALYWVQSKPCVGRLEITLTDVAAAMPLYKFRNKGQTPSGLNCFDLAEHKIVLQPGRPYKWSVIYYAQRDNPSANIVESAGVFLLKSEGELSSPDWKSGAEKLAAQGAWYDVTDMLFKANSSASSRDPEAKEALQGWLKAFSVDISQGRDEN